MDILRVLLSTENVKMQYELVFMLLCLLLPAYKLKDRKKLAASWSAVFLFFIYIHRTLLPFLVSGIWFFALAGICSVLIYAGRLPLRDALLLPLRKTGRKAYAFTEPGLTAFGAVVLLILLIQLCRINICIDYDSIRYGLRSDVLLSDNGLRGFFESMGLVNMVYTYPKGYELLILPMLFGRTYGYALCFNVWILIAVLLLAGSVTERVTGAGSRAFAFTALITSLVPGITNMAVTAKSDLITLLCQLMFVYCFVSFFAENGQTGELTEGRAEEILTKGTLTGLGAGALIASWAFKPTSLIFSSLLGLCAIAFLVLRHRKIALDGCGLRALVIGVLYTAVMTLRTFCITGMPFTSIFTGLLSKLGFTLKYPYRQQSVVYEEDAGFTVEKLRTWFSRVFHFLFCPTGEDMSHVIMAWGGIAVLLMLAAVLLLSVRTMKNLEELETLAAVKRNDEEAAAPVKAGAEFLNLALAVTGGMSLVSLWLLYQVDGNYFQLFYALTVIAGSTALFAEYSYEMSELSRHRRKLLLGGRSTGLVVLCAVMVYFTAFTSWTGAGGFTPVDFVNKGYYDHVLKYGINNPLNWEKDTRVVAFASEPDCYRLEGRVESWVDIDGSGGNVYLTDTKLNIFKEYLTFADIDYIYADTYFLNDTLNQRHIRANTLFRYLLEDGDFSEITSDPSAPNRIFAKIDKDRISVGWETEMSEELTERIREQTELYEPMLGELQ